MTAVEEAPSPPRGLFRSPWGLLEFQAEGVAQAYYQTGDPDGGVLCVWSTGLGKTVLSIALACLLIEDGEIDRVIVACEKGKLFDWVEDFGAFSDLAAHRYHGPGRQRRLAKADSRVLVSTYETLRSDLMVWRKNPGKHSRGSRADGPLMDALGLRGQRVLWIFDEVTKAKNRSSQTHKSLDHVLSQLRKGPHHQRVLALSATPLERDFEDAYNIGRLVCPSRMPTVNDFERRYTKGKDVLGRYVFRKDRSGEFTNLFAPVLLKKNKTDPDVVAQFPAMVEKAVHVDLHPEHRKLYDAVLDIFESDDADDMRMFGILRMTAGHPCSHLHASNPVSKSIVEALGEDFLRSVPSSKSTELINRLKPLIKGQGAQAIVFSFYGQSVLVELAEDLRAAGFTVVTYTGGMSAEALERSKVAFTSGEAEIFLASDAGARGLNLGNASYVFEFESSLTYAGRTQRINRAHRLSSSVESVTAYTLVAVDTIEESIMELVLRRNRDLDTVLGNDDGAEGFVSAEDRRAMLEIVRKRHRR